MKSAQDTEANEQVQRFQIWSNWKLSTQNDFNGLNSMKYTKNSYFTLIELLIVIAIISILASLLLPSLVTARSKAKVSASVSNLRQIYIAAMGYADSYDGTLCLTHWNPYPELGDGTSNGANWHRMIYEDMMGITFSLDWQEAKEQMRTMHFDKLMSCPYLISQRGEFPTNPQGHGQYSMNCYFRAGYRKTFHGDDGQVEPFVASGVRFNDTTARSHARMARGSLSDLTGSISYEYPGLIGLALFNDGHFTPLTVAEGTSLEVEISNDNDFQ